MATRRERVVLELEDDLTSGMMRAAAATALLNKELNSLSGRATGTSRSFTAVERDVDKAGRTMRRAGSDFNEADKSINKLTGRLRLFADAAAIIGPSFLPLGAAVVPAVAGLANQLGFAAIAGGTAILAFQGVGDALKAMQAYAIDPTDAHLQKLNQTMGELAPAGQEFVRALSGLKPVLDDLEASAQAGLFPGLTEGIEALATRAPEIERIIGTVSSALGGLLAEAGQGLAGSGFDQFFADIESQARPALEDMGHALGDVTVGLTQLWEAFLPMSMGFGSGLADVAAGFREWATSLSATEGFQNFLDYVDQTGPQVLALLGSLGDAFVQIAQAAAPLGGPVLEGLTAVAKAIAAIADSDLGTPIFTGLAALALYNRALTVTASLSASAFGPAAMGARIKGTSSSLRGLTADVRTVGTTWMTAGAMSQRETTRMAGATERLGTSLKGLGKGAAVIGGLGLITSGVAGDLGMTNTASLALAGSWAGPLGAAAGATVGAFLDVRAEAAATSATIDGLAASLHAAAAAGDAAGLQAVADKLHAIVDAVPSDLPGPLGNSDAIVRLKSLAAEADAASYKLGQAFFSGSDGAHAFSSAINQLRERTIAARQAASTTAGQFMKFGDSLDDSKVSLHEWISQLAAQARALTEFGNNAQRAANRGLRQGLIKALEEAGPAGAMRMAQLANGTKAEIARANAAWASGRRAVRNYVDTIGGVPKSVVTNLRVDGLTSAERAILRIRREILSIPRTWSTTYYVNQVNRINKGPVTGPGSNTSADGGTVPKTGLPYADRHLYLLADGEEIISNRHGQADRNRELLKAINAGRALASGGTVTGKSTPKKKPDVLTASELNAALSSLVSTLSSSLGLDTGGPLHEVRSALHDFANSIRDDGGHVGKDFKQLSQRVLAHSAVVIANQKKLETLNANLDSLTSAVEGQFTGTNFNAGVAADASTGQRYISNLSMQESTMFTNTANAELLLADLKALQAKGASKAALAQLAQSNDPMAVDELANSSAAQVKAYSSSLAAQNAAAAAVAKYAGQVTYGGDIAKLQATNQRLETAVESLTAQLKHVRRDVRDGASEGTAKGAHKGIAERASKEQNRARYTPKGL